MYSSAENKAKQSAFWHEDGRPSSTLTALWVGLVLAIAYALYVLAEGLTQPLLDMHSFRQTQTALSAYWILQGGPWLAYETPVVGYPWAIPFEFPVFQLIVALFAKIGIPLDVTGRIVSFCFFLGSLVPLRMIFREGNLGTRTYLASSILFLTSPLYLYWSRAFLIESCALFFSLSWLALLMHFLRAGRLVTAISATLCGCLAILAKATTFPAFAVVGGLLILAAAYNAWLEGVNRRRVIILAGSLVVLLFPFVIGLGWVAYSDHVKSANEFGRILTSTNLSAFNYGTMAQRMSASLWVDTIRSRTMPDTLGRLVFLAMICMGAALVDRRKTLVVVLSLIGFSVPFLVFTNLHIVHNYYQYANAIFLVVAVGAGVGALLQQPVIGMLMLLALVAGQITYFHSTFEPFISRDYSQNKLYQIAKIAEAKTSKDQSLIIFGDEWASTTPYYSHRKSFALASWTPAPLVEKILSSPQKYLGDSKLGGIIICKDALPTYALTKDKIATFLADRTVIGSYDDCQMLSPEKGN